MAKKSGELVPYPPEGARPALEPFDPLTRQFYEWEQRGRGWRVYPYPVMIEPPFIPFLCHAAPSAPGFDDGRVPTWSSRLVARLAGRSESHAAPQLPAPDSYNDEALVEPWESGCELVRVPVAVPAGWKSPRDAAYKFLASLTPSREPISYELAGTSAGIETRFVCAAADEALLRASIRSHFPGAATGNGEAGDAISLGEPEGALAVDFGLSNEFVLLIRAASAFDPDPLIPAVAALEELREGETGILQVLFRAVRNPWPESVLRAVLGDDGKPFFADAPQLAAQARLKIAQPLFAAVIRVGARGATAARSWEIARRIAGVFPQFRDPLGNEFIPLENEGYPDEDHWEDLALRRSRRVGMLLNADELVSLAHLPSESVESPKLHRAMNRTKAAPEAIAREGLALGENIHNGKHRPVALTENQRVRHAYVIGASGTGKSTLLLNLILQDLDAGRGFAVIDPHGDLVDEALARLPPRRVNDVILIDPANDERSPGFNILRAHSALEKALLASDLTALFRRLSSSWGDQMNAVLANAVLAFLEHPEGGTLADLRRFLVDDEYRAAYLRGVSDPEVAFFWEKEFPMLGGKPQAPILTRLDAFLRPKPIRAMVGMKRNGIDFRAVMDEGRVLFAKLPQGALGEENAALLGSLIVTKFHQVTLTRQEMDPASRRPFYLYLDEFHHFITPSLAAMLSGARKYRMGLVLAHQELRQLWNRDADVAAAVLGNAATRIAFRLGEFDAQKLAPSFASFEARDLQNLGVGDAIASVERSDGDFSLRTLPLPELAPELAARRRAEAVGKLRAKAAREEKPEPPPVTVSPAAPADPAAAFADFLDRHLPYRIRSRHLYIAGKSQYGKSSLLHALAVRDMDRGEGLAVIDPHGDLAERLLASVPESRVDDAIYLDATAPIPLDFMGWADERERDTLADDLLVTFKRFSNTWGERMESIVRYTIYTLLAVRGTTFLDLYGFLAREERRREILREVHDPVLRDFWRDQYPHLPRDAAAPITSRMSKFLLTPSLRAILGDPRPKLSLGDVMEQRKILIVNLAKIGEESGHLLGTLLVSKIQQAAMRRQAQPPERRIPFHLYVDEFQHFQTSAFDAILSEAGKYRLCLTMANQYIDQLEPQIRNSILGNVSTFFLFRLNERDAGYFAGEIKPRKPDELTTLPPGAALCRTAAGEALMVACPPPTIPAHAGFAETIRNRTILNYASPPEPEPIESEQDAARTSGRPKHIPPHAG